MTQNQPTISGQLMYERRAALFLLLLACVLYANTLSHQYAVDDKMVILQNKYVRSGLAGIPGLLGTDTFHGYIEDDNLLPGGRYRPLSLITFAVEYELFGLNPCISHALNVVLFALTGVLLLAVLQRILPPDSAGAAFWAAVLFVVHPVHTEVVANIKGRDELLSLLLVLCALWMLLPRLQGRKEPYGRMVLGAVLFFLALTAKEGALVFVLLLPLLLVYGGCRGRDVYVKGGMLLAAGLVFVLLRMIVTAGQGGGGPLDIIRNPFAAATAAERFATIAVIMFRYVKLLAYPHPLIWDYSYNQIPLTSWGNPLAVCGLAFYVLLFGYAVVRIDRGSFLALGILLFLVPLLPVSNLFFPVGAPMAERFLYMPSIGFCLAAALSADRLHKAGRDWRRVSLCLLLLISAAFSLKTIDRNADWHDNLTLFAADAVHAANSARQRLSYGVALAVDAGKYEGQAREQRFGEAAAELDAALAIHPRYTEAMLGQAFLARLRNLPADAVSWAQKAIACNPQHAPAWLSSGLAYAMSGDSDEAIVRYREAVRLRPGYSEAWYRLGNEFVVSGRPELARQSYETALKLNPVHRDAAHNLAVLLQDKN